MNEPPVPPDRSVDQVPGAGEEGGPGGDAGLFGPDSVTWRVHAEPVMGVAGLRAMLLQALHPVAVAAFVQHGTYREDWWTRLSRTNEYIALTTYGGTTEAMLAASRVRAIHARVHGTLGNGVAYSADDPQLLAWVHCCLVASFLEVVTRAGLALTGAEQDAYIAEQVKSAMLIGLEPDEVPQDRAGLQDYFRVIKPALEAVDVARRAAMDLVTPPHTWSDPSPEPSRVAMAGLAFAALPPWGRRLYDLTELPAAAGLPDSATTAELRSLRAALRNHRSPAVLPPAQERQERPHLQAVRTRLQAVRDRSPDG